MVDGTTSGRDPADEPVARDAHEPSRPRRSPHRVRIPGFAPADGDIGLGDAVARATAAVGIRPCGGCARRAAALNRWMTVEGRRER
ncbi:MULTISPECIES: hypothetical protein [Streptomyces]|uniref:hypothetical protein n=1 Tax=Streptomyces scabiei TaxID=1930 RepID=UPI0004E62E7C|nr:MULTISPECIES: hypothetical protein [Streptomyces]MBP5905545.1 hypothetical protein [Streptomyces sp. LBUM 1478]MBP5932058.1 hypothetical protein [Streptomyces sp. LBUM 1479]KFG05360.1 hypothetical protein IQ61_30705 [Streptomyces scabiei]MBP5894127.1 hypothetical protein [Streptomyces sp. LBUM 1481]MBP5917330.1 hypothetical protein [Streptomyces sp. LBUM 1486]